MNNTILQTEGLTKTYNGLTALNNVNITLERGKIIGLL